MGVSGGLRGSLYLMKLPERGPELKVPSSLPCFVCEEYD